VPLSHGYGEPRLVRSGPFRSSAANDLCYNARIGRHTNRAIQLTTVRPRPLA
jgi:hypothetical protein